MAPNAPSGVSAKGVSAKGASPKAVSVGDVIFGGGERFALISGPCVIESREHTLRHATALRDICQQAGVPFVFKSSFDKANRTSIDAYRGPGLDEGLKILAEVAREVGVPVLTDVHTEQQARAAGEVVDVLQIPAFLCRQTDLLLAAAGTGRPVNVKKGQFMAPEDITNVVNKLRSGGQLSDGTSADGTDDILVTDRGTSFGYRTLVVDFAGFPTMRENGQPLIFDATHAVQRPGGKGTATGGDRTKVPFLARAAIACGVDGLFMEVHEDPDNAPSDGPNMLALDSLAGLLEQLRRVQDAVI